VTRAVYLDAAVAIHAVGGASRFKDPSRALMELATRGEIMAHTSVEMVQEFVHHRLRVTDRATAVAQARTLTDIVVLHDFDRSVLDEALRLVDTTHLRGRDAVHTATALVHGIGEIISTDTGFDDVPGLTRIDPADV